MHLRPRDKENKLRGTLPPGKSAEDVMGAFLRYLVEETGKYIANARSVDVWNSVKDDAIFVLGHPNGWQGYSQQRYRRSAVIAGLVPDTTEGQARIKLVTEGEASALTCLAGGLGARSLKVCSALPLHLKETNLLLFTNYRKDFGLLLSTAGEALSILQHLKFQVCPH